MNKETVKISDEMLEKINAMQDIKDCGTKRQFTEEEDLILLNYFKVKKKREIAKLFNCSIPTIRKRYIELTEKN